MCSRALHAHVTSLRRELRALVPYVPRVLRVLVPHVSCAIRALVPHVPRALHDPVLQVPRALNVLMPHVLVLQVPRSLCSLYTLLSRTLHTLCPNITFCALEFPCLTLLFFCLFANCDFFGEFTKVKTNIVASNTLK